MKVSAIVFLTCGLLTASAFGLDYKPGQVYVTFKPNRVTLFVDSTGFTCCGISKLDSVNRANCCSAFKPAGCDACGLMQDAYLIHFPDTTDVPALVSIYAADTNVVKAGPNHIVQALFTPSDSFFRRLSPDSSFPSYQWPLDSNHLQLEKAWDITKGDSSVVIAFLDAAFAWRHPDLKPSLWINSGEDIRSPGTFDTLRYPPWTTGDIGNTDDDGDGYKDNVIGYNFRDLPGGTEPCFPNPEPGANGLFTDEAIHGAEVWGNASAATNNGIGVSGIGFNCRAMPVAFSYSEDYFDNALCFLIRMRNHHGVPHVVNMSFSFAGGSFLFAPVFLDSLYKLGVVLVASAGNRGVTAPFPASHARVLSVAGTDTLDYRASFSSYYTSVDLSAPAFNYLTVHDMVALKPVNYRYASRNPNGTPIGGTSYSSPQVAGVAALIRSTYPDFTVDEVWAKLRSSVDSIQYSPSDTLNGVIGKMGTGRINAFKALTFFGNIPGEFANDTTLHDTVYVSGDITVRNGKTLTLAAGTVLRLYPGDVLKKGVDTTKTEIVVESGGKLIIEGTSGNLVKLVSFRSEALAGTDDWRGIVVRPGGIFACSNAVIRHAYIGIEDASEYSHTIQNVKIGRCKMYGILAVDTDSLTIRGCRVDSISADPGGTGIYVISGTNKGARLVRDTVRNCYYGMYLYGSKSPVDTCVILGTGNTGIVYYGLPITDTFAVPINYTTISGYFTNQHLKNDYKGRVVLTGCNLISATSPSRTPYGIHGTGIQAYLKVRKTVIREWSNYGVLIAHNNSQVTNLGSVASPADSGFNWIFSGTTVGSWKYVLDLDCINCSTPVIKAEWNCWAALTPSSSRFSGNIDYNPWHTECIELPKIVAGGGETTVLPKPTELFQNYPNPFNPTTLIQFNLEKPEKVNLETFNILGQKVRTILGGEEFAAGPYTFLWDGKDNRGSPLSSGMYFYRLSTPSFLQTKKMALVK